MTDSDDRLGWDRRTVRGTGARGGADVRLKPGTNIRVRHPSLTSESDIRV